MKLVPHSVLWDFPQLYPSTTQRAQYCFTALILVYYWCCVRCSDAVSRCGQLLAAYLLDHRPDKTAELTCYGGDHLAAAHATLA